MDYTDQYTGTCGKSWPGIYRYRRIKGGQGLRYRDFDVYNLQSRHKACKSV